MRCARQTGCTDKDRLSRYVARHELLSVVFIGRRLAIDPRDQTYGVIGCVRLNIVLDYYASVDDVYYDFVSPFVEEICRKWSASFNVDIMTRLSFFLFALKVSTIA